MASTLTPDPASTSGLVDPLHRAPTKSPAPVAHPIVVATDGRARDAAALHMAVSLARRDDERLEVLTVEEKLPHRVRGICLDQATLSDELARESGRLGALRTQLHDAMGDAGWRLHVEFGNAARAIARSAADLDARLIVVGIGRATAAERLFGGETVSRILRYATAPVFAVNPQARDLPRRVVAAVDFSDPSLRAARLAAELIEPPGTLYLVNVSASEDDQLEEALGWKKVYHAGLETMFARLEKELSRAGVAVRSQFLTGTVTEQLVEFAHKEGADLIAAGSHSHQIVDRLLLGSVPAQLLRAAPCSVLVAPPF